MSKLLKSAAIGFASLAVAASALAGQITVEVNKTKPLKLKQDIASVAIANADIADVTVSDARSLLITGRFFGTTNLLVYNSDGDLILSTDLVVSTNSTNLVSVSRGQQKEVLNCVPTCVNAYTTGTASTPN